MRTMNTTAGMIGGLGMMLALCAGPASGADAPAGEAPENFGDPAWYSLGRGGVWETVSSNEVRQTEHAEPWKNNGFNRASDQGGVMEYEFGIHLLAGYMGAGIYVLADATNGVDRGTSYLLWFSEPKEGAPEFSLAKFIKDKRQDWAPKTRLPGKRGDWLTLRERIDTATGTFVVHCNGKEAAQFKDESPIRTGNHVSLHTCLCAVAYRDLRIRQVAAKRGGQP